MNPADPAGTVGPPGHEAAGLLARIATDLLAERRPEVTTARILQHVGAVVPGVEHASLTRRRSATRFETLASSSAVALSADEIQYELLEGPCLDSAAGAPWFTSDDIDRDDRWPRWGPRVSRLGIRSLLSIRLGSSEEPTGALNLYSSEAATFADPAVLDLGLLFASHAANALDAALLVDGLEAALRTRHEIGLAQGMIMERFELDQSRAFAVLQRLSSSLERKLRDVAHEIVDTGRLPGT